MRAELYRNCSLVRVPIKAGQEEYYLPQNVEWAKKKIDKMVIVAPDSSCVDPMDGITPVLGLTDIADLYVNLYDKDNRELMHDVSYENVLHRNNNGLRVDAVLNLNLCKLYFTQAPVADATLLLYVYYQTNEQEFAELPRKSVTVEFPLAADEEKSFKEIINQYVHALPAKIQGVVCWNAVSAPCWLTLRDTKLTYQMANIHSELCRPDMNGGTAADSQAALFLLDNLDIDFDYSNIRNAESAANVQKITFYFS